MEKLQSFIEKNVEGKRMTPTEVIDGFEQGLVDMSVDVCLIRLVRMYGDDIHRFDDNKQCTAIERSLDFMDSYIDEFEFYVKYLKSDEFTKFRYDKMVKREKAKSKLELETKENESLKSVV